MVSSQWSMDIGIDIISSWLESMFTLSYSLGKTGNMNTFGKSEAGQTASSSLGWIPREMILGRDARNVVPAEFVLQRVDIANPPSIMLVIERMIDEATLSQLQQQTCDAKTVSKICSSEKNADVDELREFLLKQYSALCNWLRWFFVTQRGPNRVPGSFRWRGRSASDGKLLSNTLASGLDDYPRAAFPNEDEYHVDLLCWIIKFTSIMAKIDVFLKHDDTFYQKHFFSVVPEFLMGDKSNALYKAKSFQELSNALSTNLDQLHWSERHAMYADVGLHSEVGRIVEEFVYRCMNPISRETKDIGIAGKIFFSRNKDLSSYCPEGFSKGYPLGGDNNGYLSREKYDIKKGSEKIQHVPHVGYVSLFPFLLTIIPTDSPKLDSVLNILEHNLLTSYGLRSLSINNTFYGKSNAPGDNPYWR